MTTLLLGVAAIATILYFMLRRKPIESSTLDKAKKQMVQMAYELHLCNKISSEWFLEFEQKVNQSIGINDLVHREKELSLVREK